MNSKPNGIFCILAAAVLLFSVSAAASEADLKAKDKELGVERINFVHYAKAQNAAKPAKNSACYKLFGAKWAGLPVAYSINPANQQGLAEAFIASEISAAAETWDAATSGELMADAYAIDYSAQYGVRDEMNAIAFGEYPNSGVIAVTSIWYSKRTRQIYEFDVLFNSRYAWGDASADPSVMDLRNIATHELGHGLGLADIYLSQCSAVTMYGYSSYGETEKRTLEQPDMTGLQALYGS